MSNEKKEVKWCNSCGRERTVTVIDPGTENKTKKNLLLSFFSPGKIKLKRRYKCTRCLNEFSNVSFNIAVIVPLVITLGMTIILFIFLYIVFFVI